MADHILIVDASPLIYAVYDTQGPPGQDLKTSTGISTGLRYGFVRSIRSYQNKTKAEKVVIAFDTKGPVVKAEGMPHYKSDRVFTDEKLNMYGQVPDLRLMLSYTKWTQLDAPGYEADDIIGALARAKAQRGDMITIVSADNDLCQLVGEKIRIFRPGSSRQKTKDHIIDEKQVESMFGVRPEQLCVYRAIIGDESDHLPGIVSGDKAKKEIAEWFRLQPHQNRELTLDAFMEKSPDFNQLSPVLLVPANIQKLEENYRAMRLHRPPTINVMRGKRDKEALNELFQALEFNSMFKYLDELTGEAA